MADDLLNLLIQVEDDVVFDKYYREDLEYTMRSNNTSLYRYLSCAQNASDNYKLLYPSFILYDALSKITKVPRVNDTIIASSSQAVDEQPDIVNAYVKEAIQLNHVLSVFLSECTVAYEDQYLWAVVHNMLQKQSVKHNPLALNFETKSTLLNVDLFSN